MATKTISIELDVYERLKALRNAPSESFSRVLRRALPDERIGVPAIELLRMNEADGGLLKTTPEGLQAIERFREEANVWRDPWNS